MRRITQPPRISWQERVEKAGLAFHHVDGELYWDESASYEFSSREIDLIDDATAELHRCCLTAVDRIIRENRLDHYHLPTAWRAEIVRSWETEREEYWYGRMDFSFRDGTPKLLEYNADTPTALLEAGVIQWFWLEDQFGERVQSNSAAGVDQFNSIHEKLTDLFKRVAADQIHFAFVADSLEDFLTIIYLEDVAGQQGKKTAHLTMEEIGFDNDRHLFMDQDNQPISCLFKLYPWEWIINEPFAAHIPQAPTKWREPLWKILLSGKALLPLLWGYFPDHPNLLPAYFSSDGLRSYARKPLWSRGGANIHLVDRGKELLSSDGSYNERQAVYQEYCPLPSFSTGEGDVFAVVGSWIIDGRTAGIGLREDHTLITRNTSRFIPHYFRV